MAKEIATNRPSKAKHGMKLHHFIATGGKPSAFKGMVGKVASAKTDAAQVGSELKEKKAK
jgi:hypothetical protein